LAANPSCNFDSSFPHSDDSQGTIRKTGSVMSRDQSDSGR
jgi:hypothetical protein